MKCTNCGTSISERPLYRTNPKGESPAGWMCVPCIEKVHPELAKNTKEDMSDFEKEIVPTFYPVTK